MDYENNPYAKAFAIPLVSFFLNSDKKIQEILWKYFDFEILTNDGLWFVAQIQKKYFHT